MIIFQQPVQPLRYAFVIGSHFFSTTRLFQQPPKARPISNQPITSPLTPLQTGNSHGCRNRSHASSSVPRCTSTATPYAAPRRHSYAAESPPDNSPHSSAYAPPDPATTPPAASPNAPAHPRVQP